MFDRLNKKGIVYKLKFDKLESKKYDDSLMATPFLKYVYAKRLWSYPDYFKDQRTKTRQIKIPVLIISGTSDYTIGVNHNKLMQFPNQVIKLVEGGHALYLEHTKKFYNAVAPFLKQYGRPAA